MLVGGSDLVRLRKTVRKNGWPLTIDLFTSEPTKGLLFSDSFFIPVSNIHPKAKETQNNF